jgi:hypothetical protein
MLDDHVLRFICHETIRLHEGDVAASLVEEHRVHDWENVGYVVTIDSTTGTMSGFSINCNSTGSVDETRGQ